MFQPHPELITYVSKARLVGMTDEQIRTELLNAGWGVLEIRAALNEGTDAKSNSASFNTAVQIRKPLTLISSLVVLIFVLMGGVGVLWNNHLDLTDKNNVAVKDFFVKLAEGQVGFVDAAGLVYPDDQKFLDAKQLYLEQRSDFIEADLDAMRLRLYQSGAVTKEFAILAKGKDGSWWETPTGDYRVMRKEANHFSSIGKVWMPWSIQFYGNFFIHGWPYYENGERVQPGHSGGCIRLETSDAKELYQLVESGTPVLVKESTVSSKFGMATVKEGQPPAVSAASFLVANASTGETLIEKSDGRTVQTPVITKLVASVVASELVYLERAISVQSGMLAEVGNLFDPKVGEQYIVFDLLYPMLMQSSDHAANIIAGFVGKDKFTDAMNQKAGALGMASTHFGDVRGDSVDGSVSSLEDILKLLQYIYFKRSFLFNITKGESYTTYSGLHTTELANLNGLVVGDPRLIGVQRGSGLDSRDMVSMWEFRSAQGAVVPVVLIVLGSADIANDTLSLVRWVDTAVEIK